MALHDPIAPMHVVATNEMFRDPALADLSDAELDEYRATRDLDAIRERLQGAPTVFVVQRLPPTAALLMRDSLPAQRTYSAFCLACHEVRLPDGAVLKPEAKRVKAGQNGLRVADGEWINDAARRFGLRTVEEIAQVAYEWGSLPESAVGPFVYSAT